MSFKKCFPVLVFAFLLITSFFGFFPKEANAASDWTAQVSAGQRQWQSIAISSDGTKLAAVSQISNYSGDYVYTSTNSGITWIQQTGSGLHYWQYITSSSDGMKLAAVSSYDTVGTNNEYVYTSIDGGVTWLKRTSAGSRSWTSITSDSTGSKLAATVGGGYIYTSIDSGATWTEQTSSGSLSWYSITSSSDGTKLAAVVASRGYIYTSINSGVTWVQRTTSGLHYWGSIASSSDGMKLLAGGKDYICTSTDGGATWNRRTIAPSQYFLISVASSSDGTKLVAGNYGTIGSSGYIYTSTDSGATWIEITGAGSRNWETVVIDQNGINFGAGDYNEAALGNGGYIYTSFYNPYTLPTISTSPASFVLQNSATLNGNITNTGGEFNTVRGFEYGLTTSYGLTTTESGSFGSGSFISNITSLTLSTTYHYRSYSTNSVGTTYGSDVTFTTPALLVPTLTTQGETLATNISATLNGTVSASGGNTITVRGFQYGLTTNYGLTTTESGSFGIGNFSADVVSLIPNSIYHYRAYATNGIGTGYSADSTLDLKLYGWMSQTNAGSHNWASLASSSDGVKLAAIGDTHIYISINGGNSWTVGPLIYGDYSIDSSSDGTKIVAVGLPGRVYVSNDSGDTWSTKTPVGNFLQSVAVSSDGTKIVIGSVDGGNVFISKDSGSTWISRSIIGTSIFVTSSSDGTKLAAVANNTNVYTSTDGGLTWIERTSSGVHGWLSIDSSSDGNKLVAVGDGIYTSTDGGVSWIERIASGLYKWRSVASSSDGVNLIAGTNGGYLYVSSNSGVNWSTQDKVGKRNWRSVSSSSDGIKLAAAAYDGYIYTYSSAPVIVTEPASSLSETSILLKGSILNAGKVIPTSRGFEYGLDTNYTKNTEEVGSFTEGTFSANISSLETGTTYHYRSYATNSEGTGYGQDLTFIPSANIQATSTSSTSGSSLEFRNKFIAEQKALALAQTNTTVTPPSILGSLSITKTLKLKVTSNEVKELQKYLNANGYVLANIGAGSLGKETTYFGPATKKAVIAFQKANKLTADGIVGKATVKVMNSK